MVYLFVITRLTLNIGNPNDVTKDDNDENE